MQAASLCPASLVRETDQQLRVCILCPGGTDASGGIGRFVANLVAALGDKEPRIETEVIDTRGPGHIAFSPLYLARALARLATLGARGRVAVIHANVSSHGSAARKLVCVLLGRVIGVPVVLHLHAAIFEEFYRTLSRAGRALLRWMFQNASTVVVLGSAAQRFVVDVLGVPSNRVKMIPNGVRAPDRLCEPHGSRCDAPSLLFIGRIGRRKGVHHLIDALAAPELRRHAWRATIAGDGDPTPFMARARQRDVAHRIDFLGWQTQAQVADLLRRTTILALPSQAEGLPMSVLEGLAYGVPAIATPVGALPDYLIDGVSVLFVPLGDEVALAGALDRLMSDPQLRERIAAAGQDVFRQQFDIATIAGRFAALYYELGRRQVAPDPDLQTRAEVSDHAA